MIQPGPKVTLRTVRPGWRMEASRLIPSCCWTFFPKGRKKGQILYGLEREPGLCTSRVREPCQRRPLRLYRSPLWEHLWTKTSLRQKTQVLKLSHRLHPPAPNTAAKPEVQPERLCPLQEVVGRPQGIARVGTPFSLSGLNQRHTRLGRFLGMNPRDWPFPSTLLGRP